MAAIDPSPLAFNALGYRAASDVTAREYPIDDIDNYEHMSPDTQSMRRLRLHQVLRLRCGDLFTMLVPSMEGRQDRRAVEVRRKVLGCVRGIISEWTPNNADEPVDHFIDRQLDGAKLCRGGKVVHSFNVRLLSYPERYMMEQTPMPNSEINYLLEPNKPGGEDSMSN